MRAVQEGSIEGTEPMPWVELLADDVGPRRPTGRAERLAAQVVADRLRAGGIEARLEPFDGYASFGLPFGLILGTAIAPSLIPPGRRRVRSTVALLAAAALATEGSLTHTPLSRLLARRGSQNLVASVEPSGAPARTLCVMAHIDSSRSGLIFHPRLVGLLGRWITLNSVMVLATAAAEPIAGGTATGRRLLAGARTVLAGGLGLLLEREIRGVDVPGANDNASGCAVALSLTTAVAAAPLSSTRLVVLLTGCEEAGTLGASAFLDAHDTNDWLFLNVDNVGGSGTLRYLTREGVITHWKADPAMARVAEAVAERQPDLRMAPEPDPAGLTYDASPVLARGGRALTLSIQDGAIENLHQPSDTVENVDPDGVRRTLAAAAEIAAAVDRGEAD